MKWINHTITTITAVNLVGINHPLDLILVGTGAIFPDAIEIKLQNLGIKVEHRGLSHSFLLWLIIFSIIIMFLYYKKTIWARMGLSFVIGVFGHLFGDILTKTGIPLFVKQPRIKLKLFKTGSIWEYMFSLICIAYIGYKIYFN